VYFEIVETVNWSFLMGREQEPTLPPHICEALRLQEADCALAETSSDELKTLLDESAELIRSGTSTDSLGADLILSDTFYPGGVTKEKLVESIENSQQLVELLSDHKGELVVWGTYLHYPDDEFDDNRSYYLAYASIADDEPKLVWEENSARLTIGITEPTQINSGGRQRLRPKMYPRNGEFSSDDNDYFIVLTRGEAACILLNPDSMTYDKLDTNDGPRVKYLLMVGDPAKDIIEFVNSHEA